MHATRLLTVLLVPVFFSVTASAQVFDPGPSDPALFTNVLNLPGDVPPDSLGKIAGETTQLNIADEGTVGDFFDLRIGNEVNISGGCTGHFLIARQGSEMNISGGSVGVSFRAVDGSAVELVGGEFKLNGETFNETTITFGFNDVFGSNDILTGTLADGSAFIFSQLRGDRLSAVSLTSSSQPLPEASPIPIVVATPVGNGPQGLRQGQSLTLQTGGELAKNFAVVDAMLNVEGGTVLSGLEVAGGVVNISGGSVGDFFSGFAGSQINISSGTIDKGFNAYDGSEVNIIGGTVGTNFNAQNGSVVNISGGFVSDGFDAENDSVINISGGTLSRLSADEGSLVNISGGFVGANSNADDRSVINISGGSVGEGFDAEFGSEINISGGSVGGFFDAENGSVVNISGGSVGEGFQALFSSTVNISGGTVGEVFHATGGSNVNMFGSDFVLDGVLLDDLIAGEALTILDRDVTLSGLLADGSAFSFDLNSDVDRGVSIDQFELGATLTVTLVPEPLLGDCNQDGVVNFLDIGPFILILSVDGHLAEADTNEDGVVTFLDIGPFIVLLSS